MAANFLPLYHLGGRAPTSSKMPKTSHKCLQKIDIVHYSVVAYLKDECCYMESNTLFFCCKKMGPELEPQQQPSGSSITVCPPLIYTHFYDCHRVTIMEMGLPDIVGLRFSLSLAAILSQTLAGRSCNPIRPEGPSAHPLCLIRTNGIGR